MATLNTQFLDFLDWWLDELRAIWTSTGRKQDNVSARDWIVSLAEDGIRAREAGVHEHPTVPLALSASADEICALFQARPFRKPAAFHLQIQPGLFLTRRLASRRLPSRQARSMAELDLLASTPIDPTQVHIMFAQNDRERDCRYYVVKTKTLTATLEAVRRVGGTVRRVSLVDTDQRQADGLSLASIWPETKRDRRLKIAWTAAWSILLCAVLITFGHAEWRYWQGGAELDAQIANAQMEAKAGRAFLQKRHTTIEHVERIRSEKETSVSLARVWAELTHLFPDTAWLTDLSSKGGELTISGFSTSAAELIEPLDASSLFAAPEFAAPVVRVPGQEGERFTITAKIGGP